MEHKVYLLFGRPRKGKLYYPINIFQGSTVSLPIEATPLSLNPNDIPSKFINRLKLKNKNWVFKLIEI